MKAELDIEKKYKEKSHIKRVELDYEYRNYIIFNLEEKILTNMIIGLISLEIIRRWGCYGEYRFMMRMRCITIKVVLQNTRPALKNLFLF